MGGAAAGVAAATARARRRVISHFLSHHAVSADSAIAFAPESRLESRFFDQLCRKGVLVAAGNDRWYIDVPRFDAFRKNGRRHGALALGVTLGAIFMAVAAVAWLGPFD